MYNTCIVWFKLFQIHIHSDTISMHFLYFKYRDHRLPTKALSVIEIDTWIYIYRPSYRKTTWLYNLNLSMLASNRNILFRKYHTFPRVSITGVVRNVTTKCNRQRKQRKCRSQDYFHFVIHYSMVCLTSWVDLNIFYYSKVNLHFRLINTIGKRDGISLAEKNH